MARERIQKVLAAAGVCARRASELLVLDGRVKINGKTVRSLPQLVDPAKDAIAVDGKLIHTTQRAYYLLNKPKHVLCTHNDPADRKRAVDLMVGVKERLFPVGRLDADSTGLLIMTNDGELTQKLTHPRFGVPKTYRAEIVGQPSTQTLDKLRGGVWLAEGKTGLARISIIHQQREKTILEITLREGRNREIRRMLAKIGHKVRRLSRICIGRISTRKLPLGAYRKLTPSEVKYLFELADEVHGATGSAVPRKKPATRTRRLPSTPTADTAGSRQDSTSTPRKATVKKTAQPATRRGPKAKTSPPKRKFSMSKAAGKTASRKKTTKRTKAPSKNAKHTRNKPQGKPTQGSDKKSVKPTRRRILIP